MEQINYEKLLPTKPPEGMISWLSEKGSFKKEYIVYKSEWVLSPLCDVKERMVHCVCSGCEREWYSDRAEAGGCHNAYSPAPFGFVHPDTMEDVISGNELICPFCGVEAEAIHVGNIRHGQKTVDAEFPMSVHRVCGRLALIVWRVIRNLYKDGHTSFYTSPYEAYVAEDRKVVKLQGYYRNFSTVSFLSNWEQRKRFVDTCGKLVPDDIYPFEPDIMNGTSMENSKLDVYIKSDKFVVPVSYMNLYLKHKNVENLVIQGMSLYINEQLLSLFSYYYRGAGSITQIKDINWKEKKPHKMLGLTKTELKYASRYEWNQSDLKFYNNVKAASVRPEDVADCKTYGFYRVESFIEEHPSENIMKVIRYLDRQRRKYPGQREPGIDDLTDYWNMLVQLGEDIHDKDICYPQNLIRSHDRMVEMVKYKENAELAETFNSRAEALSQFDYLADGLFIRPAASEAELIEEGKNLHHCVGGYAKSHANGKTAIFFIRHVSEPDVSYFTLELDEKKLTVKQNRGKYNCARTDEVKLFEKKWLEHIRNLSKEDKNNDKRANKTGRSSKVAA